MIKQIYIFIMIIYYDDLETRQSNKHSSIHVFSFPEKMVLRVELPLAVHACIFCNAL